MGDKEVSERSGDAIVSREAHLTTNPRIVVVLLAELQVNLERLNLKNTVGQGQRRRSVKVASCVTNDRVGVNLLKGGAVVYVGKDFNESFVQRVCAQQSSRDVLAGKLTSVRSGDRSNRRHFLIFDFIC